MVRERAVVGRTFDSGIILVYEMALDELNGESRLSDTWQWAREEGLSRWSMVGKRKKKG